MKKIVCEMCGNSDLLKQGDYFVCQFCSTKYTLEDARKLMIEGTVEVQGTVKVDDSDVVKKHLQNARRSKQKEDWEEVTKYYNLVEQNDPKNIEAIFYSAYGKAMMSLLTDSDIYKRQQIFNVVTKSVSVLDDYFDSEKNDELKDVFRSINKDITNLLSSGFVYEITTTQHNIYDTKAKTIQLQLDLAREYGNTLINITRKCDDIFYNELISDTCKFMIDNIYANNDNQQHIWRTLYEQNYSEMQKKGYIKAIEYKYTISNYADRKSNDKKQKREVLMLVGGLMLISLIGYIFMRALGF